MLRKKLAVCEDSGDSCHGAFSISRFVWTVFSQISVEMKRMEERIRRHGFCSFSINDQNTN